MPRIKEIIDFIDAFAPFDTAEEWDNVGLLVGNDNHEIDKALLCLDITNDVIKEAIKKDCKLIISHHPVIFNPIKKLEENHPVYSLAKNEICALCLHTNLDKAPNGVNETLANKLELKNQNKYPNEFLIIGELKKAITPDEFADYIKDKLNLGGVKYTKGKKIKKVAVSSGGAGEFIFKLSNYDFDAFVTGDMKHHEFLFANEMNISAYEAGHYNTEQIVVDSLQKVLKKKFKDTKFIISKMDKDPNLYR